MPAPIARGIIITVTVLVAASLAAYENPQVRAWIERTRHKIAMGFNSLGDAPRPMPRRARPSTDASMHEEKGEMAEARRQRAVAEIEERGRLMEERRKKGKVMSGSEPHSPSFDTLVDEHGHLRAKSTSDTTLQAAASAFEANESINLRSRMSGKIVNPQPDQQQTQPQHPPSLQNSMGELIYTPTEDDDDQLQPFESRYEREMRVAWNIPLGDRRIGIPSSHASESLVQLTPSTDVPDPDYSVPSATHLRRPVGESDYFFQTLSNSGETSLHHNPISLSRESSNNGHQSSESYHSGVIDPPLHAPSLSGSISDIHTSEVEDMSDDVLSEPGDGIRTPGSVWTEVDSTVSGDL